MTKLSKNNDAYILAMYAHILMARVSDMCHVRIPTVSIKFIKETASMCNGDFSPTTYMRDAEIRILIPRNCSAKTLKEDLEITVLHEFAHYEHSRKKLRTAQRRRFDSFKYTASLEYEIRDEKRTWLRTRELAKQLRLWNLKSFQMCLNSSSTASILFERE